MERDEEDFTTVAEVIRTNLSKAQDKGLELLPEDDLMRAVEAFAEKDSKTAIADVVSKMLKEHQNDLIQEYENDETPDAAVIREHVKMRTQERNNKAKAEEGEEDLLKGLGSLPEIGSSAAAPAAKEAKTPAPKKTAAAKRSATKESLKRLMESDSEESMDLDSPVRTGDDDEDFGFAAVPAPAKKAKKEPDSRRRSPRRSAGNKRKRPAAGQSCGMLEFVSGGDEEEKDEKDGKRGARKASAHASGPPRKKRAPAAPIGLSPKSPAAKKKKAAPKPGSSPMNVISLSDDEDDFLQPPAGGASSSASARRKWGGRKHR